MKMDKKVLIKFVLIVLCFLFTGCTNKQNYNYKNNKPVIGIVTKSTDSEYWMSLVSLGLNPLFEATNHGGL